MPNRILRESILDSEAVNALTAPAEVFYRRLMSVVDDFGRFDGRVSVIRSRLFPLRVAEVREADISRWIAECEKAGLIALYSCDGKPYILFHKLGEPRAKASKYPPPQALGETKAIADESTCAQTRADANICAQTQTYVPYSLSLSDSNSRPTSEAAKPAEVGQVEFDPLKESERARKAFIAAWNAAGLLPIKRLNGSLQGHLNAALLDPWWAESYLPAIAKAGRIPFLRDGTGRRNGRLDPADFLRDVDVARQILDGKFDPRQSELPPTQAGPPKVWRAEDNPLYDAPSAEPMKFQRRTQGPTAESKTQDKETAATP